MLGRKGPSDIWLTGITGTHFSLIRDEDLIRVDHNGNVVEGGKNKRLNYGAYEKPLKTRQAPSAQIKVTFSGGAINIDVLTD